MVESKLKQIEKQTEFCKELMNRIAKSVDDNIEYDSPWWGVRNHTQIQNDIIRLRRELNELNKLLKG